MDPNRQQSFNPDQNPFEAILAGGRGQPAAPLGQIGELQPTAPTGQIAPDVPIEERPTELQLGKTGDNSKPLLAAIHNLHNYISLSTSDASEIRVVRNLISALTQLVAVDQQRSADGVNEPPPEIPEAPATGGTPAAGRATPTAPTA